MWKTASKHFLLLILDTEKPGPKCSLLCCSVFRTGKVWYNILLENKVRFQGGVFCSVSILSTSLGWGPVNAAKLHWLQAPLFLDGDCGSGGRVGRPLSEDRRFNSRLLQSSVKVSLGKILIPKLLLMAVPVVYEWLSPPGEQVGTLCASPFH